MIQVSCYSLVQLLSFYRNLDSITQEETWNHNNTKVPIYFSFYLTLYHFKMICMNINKNDFKRVKSGVLAKRIFL